MKKLNYITLEHVMQSLLSKKENELLNSIIQKLNWNIDDLNHLIDNINTQKDIIYFIVLGDWIKEACTEIYKLYEKYTNNFVYKENNSRKLANDKFKAIRSFIVAHPLNTSSHPNGYTGALKAPVRCFGNHLSEKRKSLFQTDNKCGGAAILKNRTSRMGTPVGC